MVKKSRLGCDSFARDYQKVQQELNGAKRLEFRMMDGQWVAVIRK